MARKFRRRPKNVALILAGGVGARANMNTPKQFVVIEGKPVIVHTLEKFNKNKQIDAIVVVLLEGWSMVVERYVEEFSLHKVKHLVQGDNTGQLSIKNGVDFLKKKFQPDDIIIVHDGVRPLVTDEIINANISGVLLNGSAITVVPATEALLHTTNGITSDSIVNRATTYRTQTPQSMRLSKLCWLHDEAQKKGINNSVATCTLMIELGEQVHFAKGDNSNFKITTGADIRLFEAYLKSRDTIF